MNHHHFIGIGGIGMSALAKILLERGCRVSGSDIAKNLNTEKLSQMGATIYLGQNENQISSGCTVVYSSDISTNNPEYLAAIQKGCSLIHRSDLLSALTNGSKTLCVAGTHGKTTTSSLLATVLHQAHLFPSFAIGGVLPEFGTNAANGKGEYFVVEADESDRSFLKYSPFGAICTNIDNDHLINYDQSMDLLISHFNTFLSKVENTELLLWCKDNPHLNALRPSGHSYGFDRESDWKIHNVSQIGFSITYDLSFQGNEFQNITLPLSGHHNILNSAAVFALCKNLNISEERIRFAFSHFKGILRRCEKKGNYNGIDFIDDYAHHPTEIATTLEGIKRAIGKSRLIAVFQPHRYSRTADCLGQYGTIFDSADLLIITDIYGAGETPISGLTSDLIEKEIKQHSKIACQYVPRLHLKDFIAKKVKPFDVVVSLGAGDITKLSQETLTELMKSNG